LLGTGVESDFACFAASSLAYFTSSSPASAASTPPLLDGVLSRVVGGGLMYFMRSTDLWLGDTSSPRNSTSPVGMISPLLPDLAMSCTKYPLRGRSYPTSLPYDVLDETLLRWCRFGSFT